MGMKRVFRHTNELKISYGMKIIFFGTSEFGAIILKKLVQAGYSPVLVVTTPDKPAGRKQMLTPPPVKVLANAQGLEAFQPEKFNQDAIRFIQEKNPDLFVVAAYGKILPKTVLSIPQKGSLNVHPSLLPKYRGPSPVQAALLNGDKETGVSIIVLDEAMDHGPIIASSNFKVQNPKLTYPELHNELAKIGADLLIKTIPDWIAGKIKPVVQDDSKATYTRILQKEDGRIDWSKEAVYIEGQVRALTPWPGTYTLWNSKLLKILKARVIAIPGDLKHKKAGAVFLINGQLAVTTKDQALLVEEVQLEGGKPVRSRDFLLGHKAIINSTLDQV
jgi:methionyl-tRNA formyltransferase